jgi:hypothetical protein
LQELFSLVVYSIQDLVVDQKEFSSVKAAIGEALSIACPETICK